MMFLRPKPSPRAPGLSALVVGLLTLGMSWAAHARPSAPVGFCATYPEAPACTQDSVQCTMCHTSAPALNAYGEDLAQQMAEASQTSAGFDAALPTALMAVESLDSDADGWSNAEEIAGGSLPGDDSSQVASGMCQEGQLCAYSAELAFERVMLDVCGRSASLAEKEAFAQAPDPDASLAQALDACLQSPFWSGVGGQLWQLSYTKVRPRQPFARATTWNADINLFVYIQMGNRDARELLTGDYYVDRDDSTSPETYVRNEGNGRRFTQRERRAGMLTQSWFHGSNTMGQALPRVTAAQAYRAYLGLDLSVPEGIYPNDVPFRDYDAKGVDAPECATCHRTLDPLAYMFSRYVGTGELDERGQRLPTGTYNPDRLAWFVGRDGGEDLLNVPEQGALFGQVYDDLVSWAQAAAQTEAFARTLVKDYWRLLIGHDPLPEELGEFTTLWRDFMGAHNYGVERMLHALIKTEAYGAP